VSLQRLSVLGTSATCLAMFSKSSSQASRPRWTVDSGAAWSVTTRYAINSASTTTTTLSDDCIFDQRTSTLQRPSPCLTYARSATQVKLSGVHITTEQGGHGGTPQSKIWPPMLPPHKKRGRESDSGHCTRC